MQRLVTQRLLQGFALENQPDRCASAPPGLPWHAEALLSCDPHLTLAQQPTSWLRGSMLMKHFFVSLAAANIINRQRIKEQLKMIMRRHELQTAA